MSAVKLYKGTMFLLILLILGIVAGITDSIVELVIMLTCFMISKQKYRYKYHCKSSCQCLIVSVAVFSAGLRLTLPSHISYSFSGIFGLLIAYGAQYLGELKFIKKDYEYIEPRYNNLIAEKHAKSVYSMSETELRKYCKENLLDDIDEEIVVQRLIYRRKGIDLYEKMGYSKIQLIRREKKIESKLNIKLKQT